MCSDSHLADGGKCRTKPFHAAKVIGNPLRQFGPNAGSQVSMVEQHYRSVVIFMSYSTTCTQRIHQILQQCTTILSPVQYEYEHQIATFLVYTQRKNSFSSTMQHFKLATELKSEVKWAVTLQGVGLSLIHI